MQRKVPAEKASVSAVTRSASGTAQEPHADPENSTAPTGIISEKPRLTRWARPLGTPARSIRLTMRQGVGRLVDERGDEDPERARRPAAVIGPARRRPGRPRRSRCAGPGRTPRPPSAATSPWSTPPAARGRGVDHARRMASAVGMLVGVGGTGLRGSAGASWWWKAKNRSRKNSASKPAADQFSVPTDPCRIASGIMWKNAAPSIAPAAKLR